MGRVAIIGAGGFVGARFVEKATLAGRDDVLPVVRSLRSMARNAHLGRPHRLGDGTRPEALADAIAGCDAVVNLTTGDPAEIVASAIGVHAAAKAARARLLVHISSALVYAGIERADLPDDAPPRVDHWMPYAREKGRAEMFLRGTLGDADLRVVVLRPSLVWGPGSPWLLAPATELMTRTAYLVGDGAGVCALLHVDNLVSSIDAVLAHPSPVSGFFNVADDETTTWRAYYEALAHGLGVDPATIHPVAADRYRGGFHDRREAIQGLRLYKLLKDRFSVETRAALKARLRGALGGPAGSAATEIPRPLVKRLQWEMQTTRERLPTDKFRATFGHANPMSFADGIAAALAWLRFIGVDERDAFAPSAATDLDPTALAAG